MAIWWRDVIREATFEGHHTTYVQKGIKLGMILFIVSEVMFFFASVEKYATCTAGMFFLVFKFKDNNIFLSNNFV